MLDDGDFMEFMPTSQDIQALKREKPSFSTKFILSAKAEIDMSLIIGSALFGLREAYGLNLI